ncbi:hypothetical protein TNCV_958941 [Trichonephila clavipes]|nr:hypothetical protein TNCV_958941 [Trichonephila clavipes]
MHLKVSRHLKERYQYDMSTVECDATFHTSYHTLHNIIQQLLRQFIPFLCECTDMGVLVCRRLVSTSNLPPQSIPIYFQWGLDLENALAIRDVRRSSLSRQS